MSRSNVQANKPWNIIPKCLQLLSNKNKLRFSAFLLTQLILSLIDLVAVIMLSTVAIYALNPDSSPVFISKFVPNWNTLIEKNINIILAISISLMLLKSLLSLIFTRILMRKLGELTLDLSVNLLRRSWTMNPLNFNSRSQGELAIAIIDGSKAIGLGVIAYSLIIFSELILLTLLSTALFILYPKIIIILLPIFLLGLYLINAIVSESALRNGRIRTTSENESRFQIKRFGEVSRFFATSRNVNAFEDTFSEQMRKVISSNAELHYIQQLPKYAMELLVVFSGAVVLAAYAFLDRFSEGILAMIFLITVATRLLPSLLRIQGAIIFIKSNFKDAQKYLNLLSELNQSNFLSFANKALLDSSSYYAPSITIKDLHFSYDSKREVFHGFSAEIKPGELTAIIGKSGAGKSTLMELILGFLIPDSGIIKFKMKDSSDLRISYMPQQTFMFPGGLIENVALGVATKDIDRSLAKKCLEKVGFDKSQIESLESNFQERILTASGGEKQRIGLARCLYLKPNLLLLDEPTASLDHSSEQLIFTLVSNLTPDITVIVISHSTNIEKYVQNIIKL